MRVSWIAHPRLGDQYPMENPLRAAALNRTETRPLRIVSSEPVPTALLGCPVENYTSPCSFSAQPYFGSLGAKTTGKVDLWSRAFWYFHDIWSTM